MPLSGKAIKNRIKSVKNTKKITKAMEMVSAAKMRRAVDAALRARGYATAAFELLTKLSRLKPSLSPFLEERPAGKTLVVLITSNRGLCGSFNTNVIKGGESLLATMQRLHSTLDPKDIDVIGLGKKSALFAKRNKLNLVAVFDHLNEKPTFEEMVPISTMLFDGFTKKIYNKVYLVYTHFKSSLVQEVTTRQFLPLTQQDTLALLDVPKTLSDTYEYQAPIDKYIFEPDAATISKSIIPQLLEAELYQSILESAASEHSARMMAMKNASESAGDMINALTLVFNKSRQAAITQEIAEIASGAAAIE